MVHGHTPAASLGSRLCGTGSLGPAPAGSSLRDEADRSQEVVEVGADRSEAHWRTQHSIYVLFYPYQTDTHDSTEWVVI